MIINAGRVFNAKTILDHSMKTIGTPKFPRNYENLVEIQKQKRTVEQEVKNCKTDTIPTLADAK